MNEQLEHIDMQIGICRSALRTAFRIARAGGLVPPREVIFVKQRLAHYIMYRAELTAGGVE